MKKRTKKKAAEQGSTRRKPARKKKAAEPVENRGGPRVAGPGKKMGRPKVDAPRVTISVRVSAEVGEYLRSQGNASRTIDNAIQRTKACRDYLASR